MNAVTDQQLIEWIAAGDESLMGTLFERHHKALFNFTCRMIGDRSQAEDIVQDTFLRMLKSARRYRGDGTVKAWMFNIARNLIYDHYRHNGRQSIQDPSDFDGYVSDTDQPDSDLQQQQQNDQLKQAMDRLPRESLEALLLGKFHFDRFDDVARALDCTVGNARVKVHRAFKQLKQQYQTLEQEALP